MKKQTEKLGRKVYYLHKSEIKKVDVKAKELSQKTKEKISGSMIIRQCIAEL